MQKTATNLSLKHVNFVTAYVTSYNSIRRNKLAAIDKKAYKITYVAGRTLRAAK